MIALASRPEQARDQRRRQLPLVVAKQAFALPSALSTSAVQSGQVCVGARKEVPASTIPKQLFRIRPTMQVSAGRDPSLLPVPDRQR
jgi:hypothetical protein